MPNYPHAKNGRKNWDKHGESPSLTDFAGVVGDGVSDDAPGIQNAINDTLATGGGRTLRIPGGYTFLCKSALSLPAGDLNLTICGDGPASIVKRGANLPSTTGLFDIGGNKLILRDFAIDGAVTSSARVNYSAITDPMQDSLSLNSSIWVHGGASDIALEGLWIEHTGGYAVTIDARTADIADVAIRACRFRNNRPHLFGTSAIDLNYGSWTGGIHYQGDGTSFCVTNLSVSDCDFQRGTGNQVWGHSYAFTRMHENVRVTNNHFVDIGRDGVQLAVTTGGLVANNTGHRIGYICVDDTSPAQPKYLGAQYAVFIDTSGTAGVDYIGNSCVSALGAFFDLDGFAYGQISGNTCRVPSATDPEYTEDLISLWPGNYTYGIQTGNNYYAPGGTNVSITDNTFVNCSYGAIRLFAARGCHIAGNTINHPAAAVFAPIVLGNFVPASGGGQVDTMDCDIAGNNIQWSPAAPTAAVQELENWSGSPLLWAGEKNWVADNRIFGANTFEFQKAPSSTSTTGTLLSSTGASLAASAAVTLQRERTSGVDYTSMYDPAGNLQTRFLDSIAQFNVSNNGVKGSVTTGARLGGLAVDDTVATSHLYGDGFAALTDLTFANPDANILSDSYGLIRYDSGGKQFLFSSSLVSGSRVWYTPIGGPNISYSPSSNILTLTGTGNGVVADVFNASATGTAHAFQQASGTFSITGAGDASFQSLTLTNGAVATVFNSTATGSTNALQQASGTFYVTGAGDAGFQSVTVTGAVAAGSMTIAGVAVATQAWVTAGFIGGANISYGGNVLTLTGAGNGVIATTFNSSATGTTNAVQQASGAFSITGAGNAAFQSVAVTNGAVATVFNSTATGTTNAVQQTSGTFHITGAGDASFQSVTVTNGVAAASMTIGGAAVATQTWVSAGFVVLSQMSGYTDLAAAVTAAENYGQGQLISGLTSHLASYHGAATSHTHTVVVGGTTYTTSATDGTP